MVNNAKFSVDEASLRYQALTKLADLSNDIASLRNKNNSVDQTLQATKIRLWLKALDLKNYLNREQRERIWYALICLSDVYDFPIAPVLSSVPRPAILLGNEYPSIIAGLANKVDRPGDTMTGNLNFTGAGINTADYVRFNTTPTAFTPAVGNMGWIDTEGTIDFLLRGGVVNLPIGQKQVARVVNGTGINVLKSNYQVVKVTGAQGQRLQVNLAQANNDANSADTLGLIAENINNNNTGFIVTSGLLENINTTGSLQGETWADGNILYLSPTVPGRVTNIKPQAPQHTVIVGFVVYAHQNNGKIYCKIDNGYEIDELHNVRITSPTNGQVLKYNTSLSVWENATTTEGVIGSGNTNEITYWNSSSTISSLSTSTYPSLTELSYVKGVTSGLQSQLNNTISTSRTLTINGTTYDLTANRTWSVGTVTEVGLSVPTGFTVSNSPVTSTGNISLGFASGYSLPTNTSQTNWNTAYSWGNHATAGYQLMSQKGLANGYASLDSAGKVPVSQLPSSIMEYKGTWNASTNTPTLANGTGDTGDVYRVTVAGTQNLGSGSISFEVGDYVIYNGTIWEKSDTTDAVASVFGRTGVVTAQSGDYNTLQVTENTNLYFTNARARQAISLTTTGASGAATYDNGTGVLNIPQYQAALTNPVTGTGSSGQVAYFNGTTSITSESALFWDSTNDRLGIGTPNPEGNLHVAGSIIVGETGSTAKQTIIYHETTGNGYTSIQSVYQNVAYTPIFLNASGGNVGIGTTTDAGYKLDVNGTGRFSGDLTVSGALGVSHTAGLIGNFNSTNANGGYITWQTSGTTIADLGTAQQIFGSGGNDTFGINARGARALTFGTNNTERLRIDSSGNLGLGVTPSAWSNGFTAIQLGAQGVNLSGTNTSTSNLYLSSNGYYDGTNWKAINSSSSGQYRIIGNEHSWYTGAFVSSGSNITFTQAMTLDASGRLGIGTASPSYNLHLSGSNNTTPFGINVGSNATYLFSGNSTSGYTTTFNINDTGLYIGHNSSLRSLNLQTNSTDRITIHGGGNVGIGTTTDAGYKLDVNGTGRFTGDLRSDGYYRDYQGEALLYTSTGAVTQLGSLGAGTPRMVQILAGNAVRATFDTSGNLGLGVTPSAWDGNLIKAIQIGDNNGSISSYTTGNTSTDYLFLNNNAYYDSGGWKYISTNPASQYVLVSNEHRWYNAPSGTAGNAITFTQAMTLDASGRLGIGVSPTVKLQVETPSSGNGVIFRYTGGTNNPGLFIQTEESTKYVKILSSGSDTSGQLLQLGVNTASVSITANGDFIIGSGADTGESLQVTGDAKISQALKVKNYSTLSQTVSGAMTILGHNVISDPVTANKVTVLNSGWYSSMIKMYYNEGITFHSSNTSYNAGDTFYLQSGTTNQLAQIKNDGQLKLNNYTTTTSFSGTPVGLLAFEADGDIVTISQDQVLSNSYVYVINNYNVGVGQLVFSIIRGSGGTGAYNIALGNSALKDVSSGNYNVGIGHTSLTSVNTGYDNTALGHESLLKITTGYRNIGIGSSSGRWDSSGSVFNTTSNNSIYLGYDTRPSANGNTYEIVIGSGAIGNGSNTATIGDANTTTYTNKINVTGGQIKFPATQNASADANTLDDYEENTWTPAFANTGASITYATNGQVGAYTKIGRQVTCTFRLALSTSTMTGNALTITGLPFTSANVTNQEYICAIAWTSSVTSFVNVQAIISPNSSTLTLLKTTAASANSTTAMVGSDIGTGSVISGTITYFV